MGQCIVLGGAQRPIVRRLHVYVCCRKVNYFNDESGSSTLYELVMLGDSTGTVPARRAQLADERGKSHSLGTATRFLEVGSKRYEQASQRAQSALHRSPPFQAFLRLLTLLA